MVFFLFIDLCFKPYTLKILLVSVLFVSNRACRCVVSGLLRANLCVAGSFSSILGSRVRNDEPPNILLQGVNLFRFRKTIKKKKPTFEGIFVQRDTIFYKCTSTKLLWPFEFLVF